MYSEASQPKPFADFAEASVLTIKREIRKAKAAMENRNAITEQAKMSQTKPLNIVLKRDKCDLPPQTRISASFNNTCLP
jgi:hypothetical protein